jgi:hypothetical protein
VNGYFTTGHVVHVLVFIVNFHVYATTQVMCMHTSEQQHSQDTNPPATATHMLELGYVGHDVSG